MFCHRTSLLRHSSIHSRANRRLRLITRIKAWWLGVDDAEVLYRYGERSFLRNVWEEWRGTLLLIGCGFSFLVGSQQSSQANIILENIELNRRRHYGKEFAPDYVPNAPGGVYDGFKGYSFEDEVSGLHTNADNQITTSLSPQEVRERLAAKGVSAVSRDMVDAAEEMLQSERYNKRGFRASS